MTISYWPITGNVLFEVVTGEPFEYEEDGITDTLVPVNSALIHSPDPEIYRF